MYIHISIHPTLSLSHTQSHLLIINYFLLKKLLCWGVWIPESEVLGAMGLPASSRGGLDGGGCAPTRPGLALLGEQGLGGELFRVVVGGVEVVFEPAW